MRTRASSDDAVPRADRDAAREALRMLLVALPERLGVGLVAVALMAGLLAYAGVGSGLWLWCAWILAAHAFGLGLHRAFVRAAPAAHAMPRWVRMYCAAAVFSGLGWGSAFLLFLPVPAPIEAAMTVVFAAEVVGASTGSAGWFAASVLSSTSRLLPMALAFALLGDPPHLALAAGGLITLVLLIALGWRLHRGILRMVRLLIDNRQLSADLALRTHEAETANLAKSRFLAAASHDLGQPVHALRMLLGVLRSQKLDAAQSETVDRLEHSAAALGGLFDGLINTAKLDAGAVQPELESVPLRPLLQELLCEFEPQAHAKALRLRLRLSDVRGPDLCAVSDPTLLLRVLRNLLANAIRYTDDGGVLLAARRRTGAVAIEVWDTGIGIPERARELVFEEFQQLDPARRSGQPGAGLGLAIVRRLLRLLGHDLELHSRERRGTVFRILLPTAPTTALDRGAQHSEQLTHGNRLRGVRVLVVAGTTTARDVLCMSLRAWGCTTSVCSSAPELRAALAHMQGPPDLLICAEQMGDSASGMDALALLRDEFNRDVPALILSADIGGGAVARVAQVRLPR